MSDVDENNTDHIWFIRNEFPKKLTFETLAETFNVDCTTLRIRSEHLAIDKTLYVYRGMVKLKQYNPNKSAKYGILYRSISDSVVPYTYFTLSYAGKPEIEGSEFYVTGID